MRILAVIFTVFCNIFISNNMTRGKLAIKFPDAEGRFVKVRGRSPRTFTNLPEASGNLIANFPTIVMLLVCNIMIAEENSKKFAAEISLAG